MKTSTINLTLVATLAALVMASSAFAKGPGGFSMNNFGGNKRVSFNGNSVSVQGNGKHIAMKPGRISIQDNGKHIKINHGSFERTYGSDCQSNVVYSSPPVNYQPHCQQEVTYSQPTTYVNYQPEAPAYDPTEYVTSGLEPVNSSYIIEPGDTFYEVSLKMYRTSDAAEAIAMYNRIPLNVSLRPGTVVYLPSISADGELSRSAAPPAPVR